jgi:hypothetical protein
LKLVFDDIGDLLEKGDWHHLPEQPGGGYRREALVVAQMVPITFLPTTKKRTKGVARRWRSGTRKDQRRSDAMSARIPLPESVTGK